MIITSTNKTITIIKNAAGARRSRRHNGKASGKAPPLSARESPTGRKTVENKRLPTAPLSTVRKDDEYSELLDIGHLNIGFRRVTGNNLTSARNLKGFLP